MKSPEKAHTEIKSVEIRQKIFDRTNQSPISPIQTNLRNTGNTETYQLIQKIKNAQLVNRKFDNQEELSISKQSMESPTYHLDSKSDILSKKRNVRDILINTLMNPAR